MRVCLCVCVCVCVCVRLQGLLENAGGARELLSAAPPEDRKALAASLMRVYQVWSPHSLHVSVSLSSLESMEIISQT